MQCATLGLHEPLLFSNFLFPYADLPIFSGLSHDFSSAELQLLVSCPFPTYHILTMVITTNNPLSDTQTTQFFRAPEGTRQRQYEALRAYFVDDGSGPAVARQFGYSIAALRSLCHQFRYDATFRAGFFQTPRPGPRDAPARDRVRELAVA